jgi:hypothetical protein
VVVLPWPLPWTISRLVHRIHTHTFSSATTRAATGAITWIALRNSPAGCSTDARRMLDGCSMDARWMLDGCSMDARRMVDGLITPEVAATAPPVHDPSAPRSNDAKSLTMSDRRPSVFDKRKVSRFSKGGCSARLSRYFVGGDIPFLDLLGSPPQ